MCVCVCVCVGGLAVGDSGEWMEEPGKSEKGNKKFTLLKYMYMNTCMNSHKILKMHFKRNVINNNVLCASYPYLNNFGI